MMEDASPAQIAGNSAYTHTTYRIQLTPDKHGKPGTTFARIIEQLDYLKALGISTLYLSPPFEAREGSEHGYDGIDPTKIRDALGGEGGLRALSQECRKRGLSMMIDWVPNHLAADPKNKFMEDAFEWGEESEFAKFFLINWEKEKADGKLIVPTLGAQIGELVYEPREENGTYDLKLHYDKETGKLLIQYWDNYYPISPDCYEDLLGQDPDGQGSAFDKVSTDKMLRPFAQFQKNPGNSHESHKKAAQNLYSGLKDEYNENGAFRSRIDALLAHYNAKEGRNDFLALHDRQNYRLTEWHFGETDINYKRFFNIKDLITLCQENPEVFDYTHTTLLKLIEEDVIQGLRLDHVDGLADPKGYLEKLRGKITDIFPNDPERAKNFPIVVEKILEGEEELKQDWPAQGTTGYEALNIVQGLFLDRKSEGTLTNSYQDFTGDRRSFGEILAVTKKDTLAQTLRSEISDLATLAERVAKDSAMTRDFSNDMLKVAASLIVCEFDVYRTYADRDGALDDEDKERIQEALTRAKNQSNTATYGKAIDFIGDILLGKPPSEKNHSKNPAQAQKDKADFRWKFQQLCAPLMAIAKENTAYYLYARLRSLNEVGGDPGRFGTSTEAFHAFNTHQAAHHPFGLTTLQTHDTKLGPLTRAIINAITHAPEDYHTLVEGWKNDNAKYKTEKGPSPVDELTIYQTIIGALPVDITDNTDDRVDGFRDRMKEFTLKAIRESKATTNWINNDPAYEKSCLDFVDHLLKKSNRNTFLLELLNFRDTILPVALQSDMSQTVLQIASPGVPDIYQGIEQPTHRQSLVDPDNRRPVDFELSAGRLREWTQTPPERKELAKDPRNGELFLHTLWRALQVRADNPDLFTKGDYTPLTEGKHLGTENGSEVIAFERRHGQDSAIVVAPVIRGKDAAKIGEALSLKGIFNDNAALSVDLKDGTELENALTGDTYTVKGGALPLARLFEKSSVPAILMEKKASGITNTYAPS